MELNKFLDLDLDKFQFFNLAKILIILFQLFFILLCLLLLNSFSLIKFTETSIYFTDSIKVVLSVKMSGLLTLLKYQIKI